ncbi:MAG: hypothetical protein KDG55_02365 [Rhodocyclaceae bacterium]|nr:hypothetical protein [Rhodocyclaceae bacterium]
MADSPLLLAAAIDVQIVAVPPPSLGGLWSRDLLQVEHRALRVRGIEAKVFRVGGQCFFELPRFDCFSRFA